MITSPIFGQNLSPTEEHLQHLKSELTKAVKDVAAFENTLEGAYEGKNQAQLAYDNAGILGKMETSQRLQEKTQMVTLIEEKLKTEKEKSAKLRVARKEAEESLKKEKWNQGLAKHQLDAEAEALKERANMAGRSAAWQRQIEQSNEDYREDQQWGPHRRNATDGSKLLEELTGTNDDYFNKNENSVGNVLSEACEIDGTASPQHSAYRGRHVTFDKDDLLNAMTDAERQDFLDRRKELKELQEAGRQLKKDSAGRKAVLAAFAAKKTEFDEKFDHLRGFKGKTVMVYGTPPPTKREIMEQVNNGDSFRGGSFGYGLHPHWNREKSGAIVGSASPPKMEPVSNPPATEVSKPKPRSSPRSSGQALTPEQHCRKHARPPSSPGLKCKCNQPELDLFGIPSCWWYK